MKLRSILNEVKLIPPNRILLKKYNNAPDYYFETNNRKYRVYYWELGDEISNGIRFNINDDLVSFLDSKKIKYKIYIDDLFIDAKYFILP